MKLTGPYYEPLIIALIAANKMTKLCKSIHFNIVNNVIRVY